MTMQWFVPIMTMQWLYATIVEHNHPWEFKNRLVSDKWTRFQFRIFQRRWSFDQFHRARWWQLWPFYGSPCAHAMLTESPVNSPYRNMTPTLNLSRRRAVVGKRFHLAQRDISLSMCSFVVYATSWTFTKHFSSLQTLQKTINYR
jgi:hypothetical protein